jgi:hypothetical protein
VVHTLGPYWDRLLISFWNLRLDAAELRIAPGIRFRMPSPIERQRIADPLADVDEPSDAPERHAQDMPGVNTSRTGEEAGNQDWLGPVLEIDRQLVPDLARNFDMAYALHHAADQLIDAVVLGLRLLAPEWLTVRGHLATRADVVTARGLTPVRLHGARPVARWGGWDDAYRLTPEIGDALIDLWPSLRLVAASDTFRIARDRFTDTYARVRREDRLIDSWIALEALFLARPAEDRGDMRERCAHAITYYLGRDDHHRNGLRSQVMESYSVRAKVVHGLPVDDDKLDQVSRQTARIVGESLRKRIAEMRPDE